MVSVRFARAILAGMITLSSATKQQLDVRWRKLAYITA